MSGSTGPAPDEILGLAIADRLIAANLVEPARRENLAKNLATGRMTAEDWRLLLEGSFQQYGAEQSK